MYSPPIVCNLIPVYVLDGEQMIMLPSLQQQYNLLVNLVKPSTALRGFFTLDPVALASFLYFIVLIHSQ